MNMLHSKKWDGKGWIKAHEGWIPKEDTDLYYRQPVNHKENFNIILPVFTSLSIKS
jgi:hypothetical protein